MLEAFKRWLGNRPHRETSPGAAADLGAFTDWSRRAQVQIRTPREGEGVIIDGKSGEVPWRLEWGASQRPYVLGQELRIRAALPLPPELQAIILNRPLQEAIEKTMFEQYVEGVQTRLDTDTPAEMRWVVMYPKLGRPELGALQERYAAAASATSWLRQWLGGTLGPALLALRSEASSAFVLMVNRGKMTLRAELDEASAMSFEPYLRVFEIALREARNARVEDEDGGEGES